MKSAIFSNQWRWRLVYMSFIFPSNWKVRFENWSRLNNMFQMLYYSANFYEAHLLRCNTCYWYNLLHGIWNKLFETESMATLYFMTTCQQCCHIETFLLQLVTKQCNIIVYYLKIFIFLQILTTNTFSFHIKFRNRKA